MRVAILVALGLGTLTAQRSMAAPVVTLPVYESNDLTPHWRTHAELLQAPSSAFPEFALHDQAGATFTRGTLSGHVVVANFMFTRCSQLCPLLRASMATVHAVLHDDPAVLLLSHSVTPGGDTRSELAAYAKKNRISGTWHLLAGTADSLERVQFQGYLLPRPRTEDGPAIHSELFVLLDRHQRVRGVYNGTLRLEIEQLERDARALASSGE